VGNAAGLFIGVERQFGGRYFELKELSSGRQWRWKISRRGLRPASLYAARYCGIGRVA
jgi:hypothetical protein